MRERTRTMRGAVVAQTRELDPALAARDLQRQLGTQDFVLVVYFASSTYDQPALARAIRNRLSPARTLGCSTPGEIISGRLSRGSVVAMGLGPDLLRRADVRLVEDTRDRSAVDRALGRLESTFGGSLRHLDPFQYVGLVLFDDRHPAGASLLDHLAKRSGVPFVGGAPADDGAVRAPHVHVDGRTSTGGAAVALLEPVGGFDIVKARSFMDSGVRAAATGTDHDGIEIITGTHEALEAVETMGPIRALLDFDSIVRTLELEREELGEIYGRLFQDTPTIGVNTYGDPFARHINTTATLLALH